MEARAGIGAADERPELATSPKLSVPEHLVSPGAAPVRCLPIGAEPQSGGGIHFRLWAPRCREVVVEIEGLEPEALQSETDGYFSLWSLPARAGMCYRFRLNGGEAALPDPASRFQPEGPHGPSEIIDPEDFAWTDGAWRGRAREQLVIYEMHVGTFTPDGSWEAASRELPVLAELGITCLEIMPVADFSGRFGWGYDGVNFFAPTRLYGRPTDFRRFVDRAHALGIAVILDVVYNHFGPDGNYLKLFSAAYFTDRYDNEWGEAINFDGPDSGPSANSSSPMRAIGSTSIILTGCGSTRRRQFSIARKIILSPLSRGRCDRRGAAEAPLSSLRTSRSTPSWRARPSTAVTGSTPCGMTTSITAPW